MAIIKKIREKSGVAVGAIAIGMILFLLGGDIFSSNSRLLGKNKQVVGEIAGEEVSLQQFNNEVELIKSRYPSAPTEEQMRSVRQMAWNEMIYQIAYGKEMSKLGITVGEAEKEDMIKGNNIDPTWGSYFTDSTGQVNRADIENYLTQLKQVGPSNQAYQQFMMFESQIAPQRARIKYSHLLDATYFANTEEGKREYEKQNNSAEIAFLNIPFYSVADSLVSFTNSDLEDYYDAHQEDYERVANRGIKFVSFSIDPSETDKVALKEEVDAIVGPFKNVANDSAFIEANSEGASKFMSVNMTGVPAVLDADNLEIGEVYGPYFAAGAYRLYKVLEIGKDTVNAARASHILFKPADDSAEADAKAKSEAQKVLNQLRGGANFEELAKTTGDATPRTKSNGGDLNWFQEGRMVKEFDKAVFSARRAGLINRLVKTNFGYHIIKVTETKNNTLFGLGVIEKQLTPSDATINAAYREAGRFAQNKTSEKFDEAAKQDSLFVEQANTIAPTATYINNIRSSSVRQVVRWAYDAEIGDVSEVFELDDRFVVAVVTDAREEGVASFESVKDEVEKQVIKEKKGEYIANKLAGLSGTLEEIKTAYGVGATIGIEPEVTMNTVTLSGGGAGFAPKAVGTVFGLNEGDMSAPIIDENGVLIVKVRKMNKALESADYTIYQRQVEQRQNNAASYKLRQAVTDLSEVKDERYKFF